MPIAKCLISVCFKLLKVCNRLEIQNYLSIVIILWVLFTVLPIQDSKDGPIVDVQDNI